MRKKQAGDGTEVEAIEEKYGREKKERGRSGPDQHQSESMVKWRGRVTTERSSCCTV